MGQLLSLLILLFPFSWCSYCCCLMLLVLLWLLILPSWSCVCCYSFPLSCVAFSSFSCCYLFSFMLLLLSFAFFSAIISFLHVSWNKIKVQNFGGFLNDSIVCSSVLRGQQDVGGFHVVPWWCISEHWGFWR